VGEEGGLKRRDRDKDRRRDEENEWDKGGRRGGMKRKVQKEGLRNERYQGGTMIKIEEGTRRTSGRKGGREGGGMKGGTKGGTGERRDEGRK
jgi:hypothetical protein